MSSMIANTFFSFKGKEYSLEAEIDLEHVDALDHDTVCMSIARANQIGLYSYELEVMQSSPITYTKATGLAVDFLSDGQFDLEGFIAKRDEVKLFNTLQLIAKDELGLDDLSQHPKTYQALLKAYRAGAGKGLV